MYGKKILGAAAAAAAAGGLAGVLASQKLKIRHYTVQSPKLAAGVCVVFLSDLHCCTYGPDQQTLRDAVAALHPDVVLFGGDIIDDERPPGPALQLLALIGATYPAYYVTGNHEQRRADGDGYRQAIAGFGIPVLDGRPAVLTAGGQRILICGADDPEMDPGIFWRQLDAAAASLDRDVFSILLSHRPEQVARCLPYGYDLMLSGHAHGGQWRIPGVCNGVFAPGQGLFPQYAGGLYRFGAQALIVSRGLARDNFPVPRLFNPPELVAVHLQPV